MYENGYLDKDEFTDRAKRVKDRLEREQKAFNDQRQANQQSQENSKILANFEGFAHEIRAKIDNADFKTKRTILSLLIKKIKLGADTTNIVYKVDTRPFALSPEKGSLPHCNRRLCAARALLLFYCAEYAPEISRQSAWQFMKTGDPRISILR